ncbi:MAG TPA: RICIN domain-containing protein [Mycobacterium sp.]
MHRPWLTNGVRRTVVVAGAGFGAVLLGAGVASAADPVRLQSRLGNWCLDGPNGADAATMVNPCDESKSQFWTFNSVGQIESAAFPGECLSIAGAADGTPVTLSRCQANVANQRWEHQANGYLTSALGPCLNVFGGVAQPGTPVIAYHHWITDVADEQWDSVS